MKEKTRDELEAMYDEVDHFSEGLAAAKKGKKWFHVHPDGIKAYKGIFDGVGSFYGGVAWARIGTECFYIHHDGTKAVK